MNIFDICCLFRMDCIDIKWIVNDMNNTSNINSNLKIIDMRILDIIKINDSIFTNTGISFDLLTESYNNFYGLIDANKITHGIERLLNEGFIYTTIDDNHFLTIINEF